MNVLDLVMLSAIAAGPRYGATKGGQGAFFCAPSETRIIGDPFRSFSFEVTSLRPLYHSMNVV